MPEPIDHAIEQLCGEPLLGPRQAALIDAYTARLTSGFPLHPADLTAFFACAQILRLYPVPANTAAVQ